MFQFFQGLDYYLNTGSSEYSQWLQKTAADLPELERREHALESQRRNALLTWLY
jgi:hypothetical protein